MSPQEISVIKDALRAKGTAEEEVLRLEPLIIEIVDAIIEPVPTLTWKRNRDEMRLPCEAMPGEFDSASSRTLRNVVFNGPIPDDAWLQALSRVREIASRVDVDELRVRVDQPGHHDYLHPPLPPVNSDAVANALMHLAVPSDYDRMAVVAADRTLGYGRTAVLEWLIKQRREDGLDIVFGGPQRFRLPEIA